MDLRRAILSPESQPAPLDPARREREERKLREATQEFEALFISMMLSQMRNTVMKSELFGESREEEVWNSMMDQELAKTWARSDGVGLANLLFQQLKSQLPEK